MTNSNELLRDGPVDWKGVKRKSTPIINDRGAMFFQQNSRMTIANEIGRRHGMAQSNVPNLGTQIIGLATAWTPNGPVVVQQTQSGGTTTLTGSNGIHALWGDVALTPPTGAVGTLTCQTYSKAQTFGAGAIGTTNQVSIVLPPSTCPGSCSFNITPNTYGGNIQCFCDGVMTGQFLSVTGNQTLLSSVVANAVNVVAVFTVTAFDPAGQCIITIHQP